MEHTDAGANVVLADICPPDQADYDAYVGDEKFTESYPRESVKVVTQRDFVVRHDDAKRDLVERDLVEPDLVERDDVEHGVAEHDDELDDEPEQPSPAEEQDQSLAQLATVLDFGLADLFGEPMEWQERALCAQTDPEAFFPEKGGSTREAKRICSGCEVKMECLEYALANDERFGIWGGMSERERRKQRRRAV